MKYIVAGFIVAVSCMVPACITPANKKTLVTTPFSFSKKSTQKRLVTPPFSFMDAMFSYRKKYSRWPTTIDMAFTSKASRDDYQRFMERGMESITFRQESKDTLVLDFFYNIDTYAAYIGHKGSYYPNAIAGNYVFVVDSVYTFFKINLVRKKSSISVGSR